jgi:hypothetical protein
LYFERVKSIIIDTKKLYTIFQKRRTTETTYTDSTPWSKVFEHFFDLSKNNGDEFNVDIPGGEDVGTGFSASYNTSTFDEYE